MAAITTAAIGVAVAGAQIYQGEQQKKKAKRALNSYERQELDNAFEDIQISTFGSDLLREENARTSASLVQSMQNAGSRSIIGGIPKVVSSTNQINQQAAKLIDDQVINREYAIAGDNGRIEGVTENRDNNNINALNSTLQAGQQNSWNGIMGAGSAISYGAKNIDFGLTDKNGNTGSWAEQQQSQILRNSPNVPVQYTPSRFNTPYSMSQLDSTYQPNLYPSF